MLLIICNLEINCSRLSQVEAVNDTFLTARTFLKLLPQDFCSIIQKKTDLMLHLQLSRETNGISQLYLAMYFNETCKQVTVLVLSYPQFIVVEISH